MTITYSELLNVAAYVDSSAPGIQGSFSAKTGDVIFISSTRTDSNDNQSAPLSIEHAGTDVTPAFTVDSNTDWYSFRHGGFYGRRTWGYIWEVPAGYPSDVQFDLTHKMNVAQNQRLFAVKAEGAAANIVQHNRVAFENYDSDRNTYSVGLNAFSNTNNDTLLLVMDGGINPASDVESGFDLIVDEIDTGTASTSDTLVQLFARVDSDTEIEFTSPVDANEITLIAFELEDLGNTANAAPTLATDRTVIEIPLNQPYSEDFTGSAVDSDGTIQSVTFTGLPVFLQASGFTVSSARNPVAADTGTYPITATYTDDRGATVEDQFTYEVGSPPASLSIDTQPATLQREGSAQSLTATISGGPDPFNFESAAVRLASANTRTLTLTNATVNAGTFSADLAALNGDQFQHQEITGLELAITYEGGKAVTAPLSAITITAAAGKRDVDTEQPLSYESGSVFAGMENGAEAPYTGYEIVHDIVSQTNRNVAIDTAGNISLSGIAEGSHTFRVQFIDAEGAPSSDELFTVNFDAVNGEPVYTSAPVQQFEQGDTVSFDFAQYFDDPNDDTLAYSGVDLQGYTLSGSVVSGTAPSVSGSQTITVSADDGTNGPVQGSVTFQTRDSFPDTLTFTPSTNQPAGSNRQSDFVQAQGYDASPLIYVTNSGNSTGVSFSVGDAFSATKRPLPLNEGIQLNADFPAADQTDTFTVYAESQATGEARVIGTWSIDTNTAADTTKPLITLTGGNITLTTGDSFVDPGATAFDDIDGDITADIVAAGAVDINTPGVYQITYNVDDSAGNSADEVSRIVTVNAATVNAKPIITLISSANVNLLVGGVYVSPSFTASDAEDGDITGDVVVSGAVDTSTVGTYQVRLNVTDSNNLAADEIVVTYNVQAAAVGISGEPLRAELYAYPKAFNSPRFKVNNTGMVELKGLEGVVSQNVIASANVTVAIKSESGSDIIAPITLSPVAGRPGDYRAFLSSTIPYVKGERYLIQVKAQTENSVAQWEQSGIATDRTPHGEGKLNWH